MSTTTAIAVGDPTTDEREEGRVASVVSLMAEALDAASARISNAATPLPSGTELVLLQTVMGALFTDTTTATGYPKASSAAELCFTLLAYTLHMNKAIDEQLNANDRIDGDRSATDRLAKFILPERGIPHSQGALQSNTYRGGYRAKQARDKSLPAFLDWEADPDRSQQDRQNFFTLMAEQFTLHAGLTHRVLTVVSGGRMTFPRFQTIVDALLDMKTGGVAQQYLLTALLEFDVRGKDLDIVTKPINTADSVAGTPGDIQLFRSGEMLIAYEVSSELWGSKITQALGSLELGAPRVVIAARVPQALAAIDLHTKVAAAIEFRLPDPDDADIAVVDIKQLCHSLGSQLPPDDLAAVLTRMAELVRTYASTRDDLVQAVEELLVSVPGTNPTPN